MGRDKNSYIAAKRLEGDDKLLVSRIGDMLTICEKSFNPVFSGFLSEGEQALAEEFLSYMCAEGYDFFGGYEGAMRRILCIYPEYVQPEHSEFPLRTVRFDSRGAASLTHRDYLGSLMALGINRNQTGDILCDDSGAYAVLSPAAAEMAVFGIQKIGRVGVKTRYAEGEALSREDKFSELTATVSSLRLDCVISAALKVSREKAAALIRSGSVSVNHGITESVSENIAEGSILSVRGYGRFILSEIGGFTKKDRIHITVKKYL